MRAASASSNQAFLEELEAIKAISLGLGQVSGRADNLPPKKRAGGKTVAQPGAGQRVKAAAAAAAPVAKGWPTTPAAGVHQRTSSAGSPPSSVRSLSAKGLLLPGEDPAEFETFVKDFCFNLSAVGVVQMTFATRAAELSWKLRRLPAMEAAILSSISEASGKEDIGIGGMGDVLHQLVGKDKDGILMRLQQYETRIERSITRCLREVKVLQMTKLREAGLLGRGAVGSFGQNGVGSFGTDAAGSFGTSAHAHGQPSVGAREEAVVDEEASPARGPSAARQDDILAGARLGSGSFGAVGSFGAPSHAHGQSSASVREEAVVVEGASPARGPSAARQDDGLAGVRLGSGSFRTDTVGSFGPGVVGSMDGSVGRALPAEESVEPKTGDAG